MWERDQLTSMVLRGSTAPGHPLRFQHQAAPDLLTRLKEVTSQLKHSIQNDKREKWRGELDLYGSPKNSWKIAKNILGQQSSTAPKTVNKPDGSQETNPSKVAGVIAAHFNNKVEVLRQSRRLQKVQDPVRRLAACMHQRFPPLKNQGREVCSRAPPQPPAPTPRGTGNLAKPEQWRGSRRVNGSRDLLKRFGGWKAMEGYSNKQQRRPYQPSYMLSISPLLTLTFVKGGHSN